MSRSAEPLPGSVSRVEDYFVGFFRAMASPCEVLVDTVERDTAIAALRVAEEEAGRVEAKFSRYRAGNIVHRINTSAGAPVEVDEETAKLLDYAGSCHEMSDGLFDITSGALRRAWTFDGGSRVPSDAEVAEALRHVGWNRVAWANRKLKLPAGMEIDFGGIAKEYAVDRAVALVAGAIREPFLLNFGGDLRSSGPRRGGRPWRVGIDDPRRPGEGTLYRIELGQGALATSGDARRFVLHRGKRLGHILNPRTGWPVEGAPHAITVLTHTCLEAGTLSTLAYLQGPGASAFLGGQGVRFWIV